MIISVHDRNSSNMQGMGLGNLPHFIKATVKRERHGSYYFEGEYPITGSNVELLTTENILKASVGQRTGLQLFDIVKVTHKDSKTLKIYAEHVSYRLKRLMIWPHLILEGTASDALNAWRKGMIYEGHGFSVWTDVRRSNKTELWVDKVPNAKAALGGTEYSILNKWGGELEFDNFQIKLWNKQGIDHACDIAYGKNLLTIEDTVNIEETYTHVFPYVLKDDTVYFLDNSVTLKNTSHKFSEDGVRYSIHVSGHEFSYYLNSDKYDSDGKRKTFVMNDGTSYEAMVDVSQLETRLAGTTINIVTTPSKGLVPAKLDFRDGDTIKILPLNLTSMFNENPNIVKEGETVPESEQNDDSNIPEDNSVASDDNGEEGETKQVTEGEWVHYEKGWWFRFPNGKWPKNRWLQIEGKWYRFKKSGYIYDNQWFKDTDGTRYFLKQGGEMAVGWTPIKNRWRYFDKDGAYDPTAKRPFELNEEKMLEETVRFIANNRIGEPAFETTLSFVDLHKVEGYQEENMDLCDMVWVKYKTYNGYQHIYMKVVATEWDCIKESYKNITIGSLPSLIRKRINGMNGIANAMSSLASKADSAANSAYKEMKTLVDGVSDTKNANYDSNDVDEGSSFPKPPKKGFKVGDQYKQEYTEKGQQFYRLWTWNGYDWKILVDTGTPQRELYEYAERAKRDAEEMGAKIRREIDEKIAGSIDPVIEKLKTDFLNSKIESIQEEVNAQIKEAMKNFSSRDVDSIRKELDENIEATKANAELIGGLGGKVYSKNRASGQANRTIELGTDYIEVGHNGNGFEIGKEYTISWNAECTPYGHRNVTFNVQSVFFVENGHVILRPVDTRFPTIEHDINKSNRVVPMVYYGDYNIEYSGNWFKPVPVRKVIGEAKEEIVIQHTYKPIIDSNGDNATVTTWSDNPQIIIDGGSA